MYNWSQEDGDAEAAAFHDENIDQILEQRTQKRLIGGLVFAVFRRNRDASGS